MKKSSLNHIYRTIWSDVLNAWVAVSELTSAKGKRSGSSALKKVLVASAVHANGAVSQNLKLCIKPAAFAVACCFAFNAQANPTDMQVVSGTAAMSQAGNVLTVTNSPNAILNWQSFSIGKGEVTHFAQQSASSLVLNRVIGNDPSQLLGSLTSNGKVFLINPAGILVGQGARIDVAGFVASTLNLSDADYLAGRLNFAATPGAGSVRNAGGITTPEGGSVYLIAHSVINEGIITTPKGETILAAGNTVQLVDTGTPGVTVQVTGNNNVNAATNVGQIIADSGRIGVVAATVKNSGSISANNLITEDGKTFIRGKVFLKSSNNLTLDTGSTIRADGGNVELTATGAVVDFGSIHADAGGSVNVQADRILQSGAITAKGGGNISLDAQYALIQNQSALLDASNANGAGGNIEVNAGAGRLFSSATMNATGVNGGTMHLLGREIYLFDSQLDASGQQNGGTILIGGDAHGANPAIPNASTTFVNFSTHIKADGGQGQSGAGNGGKIVVWSDKETQYFGKLTARAGDAGGNGGFAEVSGKNTLTFGGLADLSAKRGIGGNLLLDPMDINIEAGASFSVFHLINPDPGANNFFGQNLTILPNGNIVIAMPTDSIVASNAGAVYLFNGTTGALISELEGSNVNDQVGIDGITVLSNGNYVVSSTGWDNGAVVNAGAVTWGSGTTGVAGSVSAANSLVGSTANSQVGLGGITVLNNGNYVVASPDWNGNRGAVTWGNGLGGTAGVVSAANSLVGDLLNDQIGRYGVTALNNGNYVVASKDWHGGIGAVTWCDGSTAGSRLIGAVSAANSLVGSAAGDAIGSNEVVALSSGNYVVRSSAWNSGAGAVTWGSGTAGVAGEVSAANSLVGSAAGEQVGSEQIIQLTNGNYVVRSPWWNNGDINNGGIEAAGAVTWGSGTAGVVGTVSAANSLVGSTAFDRIGSSSVVALANGNYVVVSSSWDNGATANVGAVTWGNGLGGTVGAVSAANSLVGGLINDQVGSGSIIALSNGNYVVRSKYWNNSTGAVTWGDGSTAGVRLVGLVSDTNSLVGGTAGDLVGSGGIDTLTNGNYVVRSSNWNDYTGAVTWGSGTTGIAGVVSAANSLVGNMAGDSIGGDSITELSNGNYVVPSSGWNGGRGAATWGSGTAGVVGAVSAANSLVGSTPDDINGVGGDHVGSNGITALSNGNYVVSSPNWANGAATSAGAATWGNGATGIAGVVSVANSLVGTSANDQIGGGLSGSVTSLGNGNYVVVSPYWTNGAAANAGTVTWGSGTAGVVGEVSAANSLVGTSAGDSVGNHGVTVLNDGSYVVHSIDWSGTKGAATWGSGTAGITGAVSAVNSLVGSRVNDQIGSNTVTDLGNGTYIVSSPQWAYGGMLNAGRVDIVNPTLPQVSDPGPWTYASYIGQKATITPENITAITNTGTPVTLQASNDITISASISTLNGALHDANKGGNISLHAGRSIIVNANITTDDGNLTLVANDTTAHGVVTADRSDGTAEIKLVSGVALDAGTGAISLQVLDGAGRAGAKAQGGDINWNTAVNVTASQLTMQAANNITISQSITNASADPLNLSLDYAGTSATISGATIIDLKNGIFDVRKASVIADSTLTITGGTLRNATLNTGTLNSSGALDNVTIGSNMAASGTLNVYNNLLLSDGVSFNTGSSDLYFNNAAASIALGAGATSATLTKAGGSMLANVGNNSGTLTIASGVTVQGYGTLGNQNAGGSIINAGMINSNVAGQTLTVNPTSFTNNGALEVAAGTLGVNSTNFTQPGTIGIAPGAIFSRLSGFTNTGILSGSGTITVGTGASRLVNQGNINPGGTGIGVLTVTGDLQLGAGSVLNIELGGTANGQYDKLTVSGALTGSAGSFGTLNASLIGGYTPVNGDAFPFLMATSTGADTTFSSLSLPTNFSAGYNLGESSRLIYADAGVRTFTNASGGLTWETAGNWSGGILPGLNDEALISSGHAVTHGSGNDSITKLTINAANSLNVTGGSLAVSGATNVGGTLSVSGGTLSLNGASSIAALNLGSGTLDGAGSLAVTSSFNRTGGTTGTNFTSLSITQASGDLAPGIWAVNGPISLTASAGNISIDGSLISNSSTLKLNTTGIATQSAPISVAGLELLGAGGAYTLTHTGNTITTLAGNTGSVALVDSSALTIGTVNTAGLNATGTINLAILNGDLTIAQNIATTDTSASAILLNAGQSTAAGTSTGGNIVISGAPTLATGAGGRAMLMTGSVAGSTGLTALIGSSSGRFRYNSDESATNYSAALGSGSYAVYREQPVLTVTPGTASSVYGNTVDASAVSGTTVTGYINGDDATKAGVGGTATFTTTASSSSHVGTYDVAYAGGLANTVGYAFADAAGHTGEYGITTRTLTASLTNAGVTKVYDGTTDAPAGFTPTYSFTGLASVDSGATLTNTGAAYNSSHVASATTLTVSGLAIGGITGSGLATDYVLDATSKSVGASITPKALTSTAAIGGTLTKAYDGTTAATGATLSGSVSGGIAGDTISVDFTPVSLAYNSAHVASASAIAASGTAGFTIGASTAGSLSGDYSFSAPTIANAAASVTPATLTVTANALSKTYDGLAYSGGNGATYTGLVSGETSTVLGGTLAYSGNSQGAVNAGIYAITPGGLTSSNYNISFIDGILTVSSPTEVTQVVNTVTTAGVATTAGKVEALAVPVPVVAVSDAATNMANTVVGPAGGSVGNASGSFGGDSPVVSTEQPLPTAASATEQGNEPGGTSDLGGVAKKNAVNGKDDKGKAKDKKNEKPENC